MRTILALLFALAFPATHAYDFTLETGLGHQGELQLRAGPRFALSEHWSLDTGVSVVRYANEHYNDGSAAGGSGYTFAADAVLLRALDLGGGFYLVAGTGPAVWGHARFGAQAHGHAWMFSNRIGVEWEASPDTMIGFGARHYSCLWCHPNSSIDFVGLGIECHF